MTIEEMKKRKRELGLTNAMLSERTGIPLGTLSKIFCGQTKSPRRETVLALESALCERSKESSTSYLHDSGQSGVLLAEEPHIPYNVGTSALKKRQGEYTLEDYLALPDDERYELIDGYIYSMASPNSFHQMITGHIYYQLMSYMEKKKGPCKPFISPLDVQLDRDNKTVVQPDVLILCDPRAYLKNGRVFGEPDFIVEVLSPSTRKRDQTLKLAKYSEAGVRELWYVDPKNFQVMVYDLEGENFPKIYTFSDSVPVHIWNDEFSVDFARIYDDIKDYLD